MDNDELIQKCIQLFKQHCRKDYIPPSLNGQLFVKHFELLDKSGDIDHFFTLMCYKLEVLTINPGEDEMSYHWQDNNFGLQENYLLQLQREIKLDQLVDDSLWCEYSDLPSPKAYLKPNKEE